MGEGCRGEAGGRTMEEGGKKEEGREKREG